MGNITVWSSQSHSLNGNITYTTISDSISPLAKDSMIVYNSTLWCQHCHVIDFVS